MKENTRTITVNRSYELTIPPYSEWIGETELKRLASSSGSHFFDADTMRAFRSRLHDVLPGVDGWYFITSEKHVSYTSYASINEPRQYTIRRLRINTAGTDLSIDTIGEFQEYPTLGRARTAAKRYAKAGALICDQCGHSPEHAEWCHTRKAVNQ